MPTIRRTGQLIVARKFKEIVVDNFQGLNTTYPYTQLKDGQSPSFYNARLYARNSTDRRVAVGTRKGPGFYSVPAGETVDVQQTSTTGAADGVVNTSAWLAKKVTAGATGRLTKVDLRLKTGTAPTQHLIVRIYNNSSGAPGTLLATSSVLSSSITSSYAYVSARFIEAPSVTNTNVYWIVIYMQAGGAGSYNWSSTTNASTALTSSNSGGSWEATAYDLNAKTYVSTNSKLLGGFRYTPSNATAKTIIGHGTNIYSVSEVDGSLTSLKSGLSASATNYYFAQSNDILYTVNGQDTPQQYDGSIWQAISASSGYTGNIPVSKFIIFHKNRLFVVDTSNPTKMVFSDLGTYNSYTSTNFIYVPSPKSGDPITGWVVFQDNLVIFTRKTKWVLFGDDPGNFILRQSSGKKGAVNQDVIAADSNYIYFLSDDGVYRYNGSSDELISDSIQTEITNIADTTKCSAVVHKSYYRLYYPAGSSTANNACIVWDSINKFWLRDSNTFIDKSFVTESNSLVEGSSLVGAVYNAEEAYSDLGKPIAFAYHTKYFGDGLRKIFLRRIIPSIRLQTQPYNLNIYIDIDQRNTNTIQHTLASQASGYTWGSGYLWGTSAITWGSQTVSTPDPFTGTEAYWHQIRFEQTGVDTPVEILSYLLQLRVRKTR